MEVLQQAHSEYLAPNENKDLIEGPQIGELLCELLKEYTQILKSLSEHSAQVQEYLATLKEEEQRKQ